MFIECMEDPLRERFEIDGVHPNDNVFIGVELKEGGCSQTKD